jgi:hypothetical protein
MNRMSADLGLPEDVQTGLPDLSIEDIQVGQPDLNATKQSRTVVP